MIPAIRLRPPAVPLFTGDDADRAECGKNRVGLFRQRGNRVFAVTAQQNPPDFGHPIRNMSKGLPESKKTSEFTLSTRVAVEYEYLGREASLKKSPIGKISFDKS